MDMKKSALIIIDIQNVYFEKGRYYLPYAKIAVKNEVKILTSWREENRTVIHVKHQFKILVDAKRLNEIHHKVAPLTNEIVIEKKYPNSFLKTDLLKILQEINISNVVIIGMMSNMCVDTTVRACQSYGIKVTVAQDACAALPIKFGGEEFDANTVHKIFMGALDGTFAKVVNTEEII